jgi:hypothetical protein
MFVDECPYRTSSIRATFRFKNRTVLEFPDHIACIRSRCGGMIISAIFRCS